MSRQERFGPFILERLLGRGGMGAVYRAKHEETGQTVAVKTLLTPLESERERFEAEISTLKLLRHENIVKLYGFGQEDGVLYYAMEYVDAPSLATLLKRGRRFTWEEAVYIGVSVCRALKHAHDRGVVHRDVKPANILLLGDGVVKITDYGIAQYFGSSRLTGANQVVGTIEYMAPEQAKAGPLTPRADLYALGALLYALLTGEPPYRARSLPELLRRYNEEKPESIRRARPEAPNVLDVFLRELLQIAPEKRPGDARLVGRRLEGILKTASWIENGNPFLNCRFSLDGRPSDAEADESGNEGNAQDEAVESFSDAAPDIPYRALSDERAEENEASPFERTTEVNAGGELGERDAGGATSTFRVDASEDGDFDLAADAFASSENEKSAQADVVERSEDAAFRRETERATAAVAFDSGDGGAETDFCATTAVETENFEAERAAENGDDGDSDDSEIVEVSSLEKYKRSRFVPVEEGELDALPLRNEKRAFGPAAQILLTCAVLGGLCAVLFYVFQAPTADSLFRRIENELNAPDADVSGALRRAEKDLRRMLELYPSDPRSEVASDWLERLEVEAAENRLERRLDRRRRGTPSSPIERAYFDALRVAEDDPDAGVAKLTAFIELFSAEATIGKGAEGALELLEDGAENEKNGAALTQAFVVVATRKLERLLEEREKARAEDLAFIAECWRSAAELASTDRERAEKTRTALIALYGERAWADEALREAKATDWSDAAKKDATPR
ncbi:MAG: serine/threonine protein kinase [Thermoguttaceae bacterium]|nr:serine/threonine protein kinase [Thermoguttaceae bacterium]